MIFKDFRQNYTKGFKINNLYENIDIFLNDKLEIFRYEDNFLIYKNKMLYYFINDIKVFKNIKPSFTKIIIKNEKILNKHEKFLKLNNFNIFKNFNQMILENNFKKQKFDFIEKAVYKDIDEIYEFFISFFDKNYLFYFSKEELKNKINNILVYKEQNKICGGLIFDNYLNTAFIDFIAIKQNLTIKNVAYALLSNFFIINDDKKNFKLFIDKNNEKAINFYKKSNFKFNNTKLLFYRNLNV